QRPGGGDRGDVLAGHAHVPRAGALRRHHRAPADQEVERHAAKVAQPGRTVNSGSGLSIYTFPSRGNGPAMVAMPWEGHRPSSLPLPDRIPGREGGGSIRRQPYPAPHGHPDELRAFPRLTAIRCVARSLLPCHRVPNSPTEEADMRGRVLVWLVA